MVAPAVELVEIAQRHAPAMAAMAVRNRADIDAVDPPRPDAFFTEAGQRARIQRILTGRAGDELRFWVIECDGEPVGDIGVTGIERGWFMSAHVGYLVDATHRGRGIATAALERVLALAFAELGLHRLDAGVLTTNMASQRVLEKAGFRRIGTVERYMYLAGGWRDNYLYERVGPDTVPADPWAAPAVVETPPPAAVRQPSTEAEIRAATVGEPARLDGRVTLMEYDAAWPLLFEREAARVRAILGATALAVEHAGSTSVPGLVAKPVVDMVLVVPDSADETAYVPALESAGYTVRIREPAWFEHRVLKGPDTNINMHVFSRGCSEVGRMLRMRDHLRGSPSDRDLYASTKRELAGRRWDFVQNYADAKSAVIGEIMARAERPSGPPDAAGGG